MPTSLTPSASASRGPGLVLALCFATILADGYDLIVFGATLPSLMHQWGLEKSALADVHSMTLCGLMVGFLVAGTLADRIGRRAVILAGVTWFSLLCLVCAFAPSFTVFGIGRVLSGVGLGAVVPAAVALASEFATARRKQLFNGITLTGYPIGGVLATVAALIVLPGADALAKSTPPSEQWRLLYLLGGALIVLVPILYFALPESPSLLAARGRDEEAREVANRFGIELTATEARPADQAKGGIRLLLSRRYLFATAIFTAVMFCCQILVYGPNTWLPSMTKELGFGGTQGILALMMLQFGAVVGTIVGALLVDRGGATQTIIPYFLLGAIALLALAFGTELGAAGLFVAAFAAGVGTVGTSTLMYGVIAAHYPTAIRASAIGFCLGIGRIGAILGPQIGALFATPRAGLLAFMVPSLVGAGLILVLALSTRNRPVNDSAQGEDLVDSRA
ncbi:MFS transporter [Rhodococcus wratislaviensis]|uniref:MFS transporter n=1 Tax=Rhodococcus wratislaviensis TaxID=44752 RepID=UPI003511DCC1